MHTRTHTHIPPAHTQWLLSYTPSYVQYVQNYHKFQWTHESVVRFVPLAHGFKHNLIFKVINQKFYCVVHASRNGKLFERSFLEAYRSFTRAKRGRCELPGWITWNVWQTERLHTEIKPVSSRTRPRYIRWQKAIATDTSSPAENIRRTNCWPENMRGNAIFFPSIPAIAGKGIFWKCFFVWAFVWITFDITRNG